MPQPANLTTDPWRVVIIGGGPGGYEAALVARQFGATVTLIERTGCGGAAVLTDVVPSKTLIATADVMTDVHDAAELGVRFPRGSRVDNDAGKAVTVDLDVVNQRVRRLATAQSDDIAWRLRNEGVTIIDGVGRLTSTDQVSVDRADGGSEQLDADVVLLAVGASPRRLDSAMPDGERILTWTQLYSLTELPTKLIVVGSGVTGAEFASAYNALGSDVVLISSRDQVLPGEDTDAANVIESVFARRGVEVMSRSRAESVSRTDSGVRVTLSDGGTVEGSHCLMAVGSVPNTTDLGLAEAGIAVNERGHIEVDGVSRTTARMVYAAGDCTGVFPLASVAAMQGRIAMWHALGAAVKPLAVESVSANIFTSPEIATVGVTSVQVASGEVEARAVMLGLDTNPRAKMHGHRDGFVKLFCHPGTGVVLGGVVVSPRASELIYPITLAIDARMTVEEMANTFTVYPSLTGSLAEAARQLR